MLVLVLVLVRTRAEHEKRRGEKRSGTASRVGGGIRFVFRVYCALFRCDEASGDAGGKHAGGDVAQYDGVGSDAGVVVAG